MSTLENSIHGAGSRIVIFWGGRGNGHIHAARAVAERIQLQNPQAEVILKDVMEFQDRFDYFFITGSYHLMTKYFPRVYDWIFEDFLRKAEGVDSIGGLSITRRYRPERLLQYLELVRPTSVLTTFSPATEAIVWLRDRGQLKNIPVAQVLIDYVSAKYFSRLGERIEMTFVPSESIYGDFRAWGLPSSKLCNSGIPVALAATEPMSDFEKAEFRMTHGLASGVPLIVLVSGAAGVGNYPLWVKTLVRELKTRAQLVAICGRDKRHVARLSKLQRTLPSHLSLKILPLVAQDETLRFMKCSDVIVTKTGGLTSTEIASFGKPVLFLDINGGQETHNSQFFKKEGMGLVTENQAEVGGLVQRLLAERETQERILAAQQKYRTALDPDAIARWAV